jgi:CheY-like chemotaxis protein
MIEHIGENFIAAFTFYYLRESSMKKNILITDDESDVYEFLGRILRKRFNCDTIWAENGLEALEILETKKIDGLILDVHMAVMDGLETLGMIRKNPNWANLPIMMCTSSSDKEAVQKILSLGVHEYLLKPIKTAEAVERIASFITLIETKKIPKITSTKILASFSDKSILQNLETEITDQFELFCTQSGFIALNKFNKERPQIVILGDDLGAMDTITLANQMKSLISKEKTESNNSIQKSNNLKIIYLTEELGNNKLDVFDYQITTVKELLPILDQIVNP